MKSPFKNSGNSWGEEGHQRPPLERKILGGGGGVQIKKSSVGGGMGYFLEQHIISMCVYPGVVV